MSKSRQTVEPSLRSYSVTHPPGHSRVPAASGWDQLLYASTGTMTITTGGESWTVPPRRALWLPDGLGAVLRNRFPVAVRSLYFTRSLVALPGEVRTVDVSGLVRELLLHAVQSCPLDVDAEPDRSIVTVLIDQLRRQPDAGLRLPLPVGDGPAREATRRLTEDPARSIAGIARDIGVSRRTLERTFLADTGITVGAWRRRARMLASLDYLGAGVNVTRTATEVGYSTPSAFVTAFKAELGCSPGRYLGAR